MCLSGESLNIIAYSTVQPRLTAPSTTKASRHPAVATMASTIGGVIAPPSRAKLCVMPCAKPRSATGIQ
ncbi:hypothetical protein D9M68_934960 [compost metagenome]